MVNKKKLEELKKKQMKKEAGDKTQAKKKELLEKQAGMKPKKPAVPTKKPMKPPMGQKPGGGNKDLDRLNRELKEMEKGEKSKNPLRKLIDKLKGK